MSSFYGNTYLTTLSATVTDPVYSSDRTTGSGAIAKQLTSLEPWLVREVRIHLSDVGGAGNLQIMINATGSEYDTLCLEQDMTDIQDLYWQPDNSIPLTVSDTFDITWANANSRTYGIEIIFQTI